MRFRSNAAVVNSINFHVAHRDDLNTFWNSPNLNYDSHSLYYVPAGLNVLKKKLQHMLDFILPSLKSCLLLRREIL